MKKLILVALIFITAAVKQQVVAQQKPALTWKDVAKWRYTKPFNTELSPDGQWMAYVTGPVEGDQEVVIRKVNDTTLHKYACGATPPSVSFSYDGRFAAFKVSAKDAEAKTAKKTGKALNDKLIIVTLATNIKTEFERVKGFDFAGKTADWIAIQFAPLETASKDKDAPKGTDVLLYDITGKRSFNLGNVGEYAFNKAGNHLAYTVDANGQNGNGVYVYNIKTGVTTAIDNDKAAYKSINWNEEGTAFALLKSNKNESYKSEVYSVIGVSRLIGEMPAKTVYAGLDDKTFTKGMGISGDRKPYWSDDLSTIYFGIRNIEKVDKIKADSAIATTMAKAGVKKDSVSKVAVKDTSAKRMAKAKIDDIDKPEVTVWNWKDKRLQSAQLVQETADKNFSYLSEYQVAEKRFIQLADSNMRYVSVAPKQLYGMGVDESKYELNGNLNGQEYSDIYVINLKTGAKKLVFENFYQTGGDGFEMAPNGKLASYYNDGIFYSINMETAEKVNLTGKIKSIFVNDLDDHNIKKVATFNYGWSADSKYALIADNTDLWRISADGRSVISLTGDWKARKLEVRRLFRLYPDDKGTDLNKPQYFNVFNKETKEAGIAVLKASSIKILFLNNNMYANVIKARNSLVYAYTKENFDHAPEYYVTLSPELAGAVQVTKNTPDQSKYAWSAGVKLIKYVSAKGDSLQAAIYLPANYEPGKAYPTITYIYERLTDGLNTYTMPGFPGTGFNKAFYTSNGYAVLMPDIKYTLNDPGMSTVACVVPAVQAAIATGIVDAKNVAIHGHSWGGYQTAFLITQTNIFKAAAAGAPLTDMISMYSLIYWNTGTANQAIFEASQGRLTPGYWDNLEAFTRNSPIFHIKNVQTPLLLLHNDKDGAVDFTQGIEFYNGLRRLNKPVVMVTYKGENHGIAKLPNRKDYAVRMQEYFDYMLKGKPAPLWWSQGINRLDMDKNLEARAFEGGEN